MEMILSGMVLDVVEYNTCCDWNSPPWFRKEISPPTSDDIEMRLCASEDRGNEDINFETLEIYVQ